VECTLKKTTNVLGEEFRSTIVKHDTKEWVKIVISKDTRY
jgi:hypothetical protein